MFRRFYLLFWDVSQDFQLCVAGYVLCVTRFQSYVTGFYYVTIFYYVTGFYCVTEFYCVTRFPYVAGFLLCYSASELRYINVKLQDIADMLQDISYRVD